MTLSILTQKGGGHDLKEIPEVQNMPSYPDDGSIKIIDNVIVVKF